MTHWAVQYIGKPWAFGAAGPDAFDCWGFTRHVQRVHFGVLMQDVDYDREQWRAAAHELSHSAERDCWDVVEKPAEGDVVMMARHRLPVHIGVWIKANGTEGVLHCLEGSGVLFQPARSLALSGWGSLQFYRRKP